MNFQTIGITEELVNGMYVYTWTECPPFVLEICTNRMRSKSRLGITELIRWKNDLLTVVNNVSI